MEGVTVSKYGLAFVAESLRKYLGESWLLLAVCLLGMIVSAVLVSFGDGKAKSLTSPGLKDVTCMNWTVLIFLSLTLYNPVLVKSLIPGLGMTTVYYRSFWAFPIVLAAAYYLAYLAGGFQKRWLSAMILAGIVACAVIFMPLNPGIRYHLQLPTNVYKVNGAIPVLADAIHEDFEQTDQYQEKMEKAANADPETRKGLRKIMVQTLPKCVFPYDMEFQVRQYDASIALTCKRDMRLYYEGNRSTGVTYSGTSGAYIRRKMILDGMYGRDPSVSVSSFRKAMEKTKTNYLVVENDQDSQDFLTAAGCSLIGDIAGYHIYSFGLTKSGEKLFPASETAAN